MRNKLPIMEQRPLLRMRQLRIQSRRKRRPLRLPQKKSQRNRRMGTKQPLQHLRIHQPLQTRRTAEQKQNMAKKKAAVLHAKNNRVAPTQNGQPFFFSARQPFNTVKYLSLIQTIRGAGSSVWHERRLRMPCAERGGSRGLKSRPVHFFGLPVWFF
jgi:hypothetical protein